MATVEAKLFTADEFWEWASRPENDKHRWELDEGEIVAMPPPGELHGVVCWLIGVVIGNWLFQRGKGFACSNDTGLLVRQSPDTVRGPDIMVFDENIKKSDLLHKFTNRIPQLIIEVLSPEDRPGKTSRRVKQYLQRGVPLVWVVDPDDQIITVYRPNHEHYVVDADGEITGEDVMPDCRFRVAVFFTLPGGESQAQQSS
jgi:Uma2 family endonuclease